MKSIKELEVEKKYTHGIHGVCTYTEECAKLFERISSAESSIFMQFGYEIKEVSIALIR